MNQAEIYKKRASVHLKMSAELKHHVIDKCLSNILEAAHLMAETFNDEKKILLCGNGGSAADCQHMAAELVSRLSSNFERKGLPAIALTTDTSILTAYSNDYGFDNVFRRQVEALGRQGDLLFGITTGGNSINVLNAFSEARSQKMRSIVLTGQEIKAPETYDVVIAVPSDNTQYIQEAHLTIEHILCDLVECILFKKA